MKNIFEISEDEKNRIRGLHETYKNTQGGLIIEQTSTSATETTAIKGCMDAAATNYKEEATVDDKSCKYKDDKIEGTDVPCGDGLIRDTRKVLDDKKTPNPDFGKCVKDTGQFKDDGGTDKDTKYDRQNPQQYKHLQNKLKALYDKAFLGKKIALYKGKRAAEKDKDIRWAGIKVGGMKETPTVKNTSPKMLFDDKEMSGMEIPTNLGTMKYNFEFGVNERGDNKVWLDGKKRYFSGGLGKVMDKIENVIAKMNVIRVAKPKTDY
tara:strand:- start:5403 stop:6197 length:795 start_codon:yes stop_codon:yes gene_type:complete